MVLWYRLLFYKQFYIMSEKDIKNWSIEKSSNIFDDFSTDSSLLEEVKKIKEEEKKDIFYFISKGTNLVKMFLIFIIIIIMFSSGYIYIQNNKNISNNSFLDPFCFLFTKKWIKTPELTAFCSSISYTKEYYETKLSELKNSQFNILFKNIPIIYEQWNLLNKKDVNFLIDKSKNRLSILKIFEKFDSIKNDFTWIDKRKIQCSDFFIDSSDRTLNMTCSAYSQWYERWIIWFNWQKNNTDEFTSWTAISIANSFLNYIEKNSKDFTIVNRQKTFINTPVSWESLGYTNKTLFDIKLKINF